MLSVNYMAEYMGALKCMLRNNSPLYSGQYLLSTSHYIIKEKDVFRQDFVKKQCHSL